MMFPVIFLEKSCVILANIRVEGHSGGCEAPVVDTGAAAVVVVEAAAGGWFLQALLAGSCCSTSTPPPARVGSGTDLVHL